MQVKFSQAKRIVVAAIKARITPLLKGPPGGGKSALVHSIAQDFNLALIDLRLSQCEPTDLLGFPTVEGGRGSYAPMDTFPVEGDPLPEGKSGWLLFLDEATSAPRAIQAAAYKLALDRMVGAYKLHPNCAVVMAGNRDEDNAIVEEMSTALQSRLLHLTLETDNQEWLDWAASSKLDHRITSFIQFKPSSLNTFKPDHDDDTYACQRTWEFADRILEQIETTSPDALPALAGVLTEPVALEFLAFSRIYQGLVTLPEILAAPELVAVPDSPSVLYALSGSLVEAITLDNADKLLVYVTRFPMEFQVVFLRQVAKRNPSMLTHKGVVKWAGATSVALF